MKYDGLKGELQRLAEEQERQRAATEATAQSRDTPEASSPQPQQTAEQLAAEMRAAQAARIAEYQAADFDRRFEMERELCPRMEAAGDRWWDVRSHLENLSNARTETEKIGRYTQQEARLTTREINKAVHQLKVEATSQQEAAPSQPARAAETAQPTASNEAVRRKADENERAEQQRKTHNEQAQARGTVNAGKAQQQGSQAGGQDLRHSSEKRAAEARPNEERLRRLFEQFGDASSEITHQRDRSR